MKIKLLVASLAAIGVASANAGSITLDNLTLFQQVTPATTGLTSTVTNGTGAAASGVWSTRTLTLSGISGQTPGDTANPSASVGGGLFSIASLVESGTATISWNLPASVVGLFANYEAWNISLQAVGLNDGFSGAGTTVAGQLRTVANTPGGTVITLASSAQGAIANPFAVSFQFGAGADSTWRFLTLNYTCRRGLTDDQRGGCTGAVPAPATVAILGLGLLGLAGLRRKQ